jgi:hypothetical protein
LVNETHACVGHVGTIGYSREQSCPSLLPGSCCCCGPIQIGHHRGLVMIKSCGESQGVDACASATANHREGPHGARPHFVEDVGNFTGRTGLAERVAFDVDTLASFRHGESSKSDVSNAVVVDVRRDGSDARSEPSHCAVLDQNVFGASACKAATRAGLNCDRIIVVDDGDMMYPHVVARCVDAVCVQILGLKGVRSEHPAKAFQSTLPHYTLRPR